MFGFTFCELIVFFVIFAVGRGKDIILLLSHGRWRSIAIKLYTGKETKTYTGFSCDHERWGVFEFLTDQSSVADSVFFSSLIPGSLWEILNFSFWRTKKKYDKTQVSRDRERRGVRVPDQSECGGHGGQVSGPFGGVQGGGAGVVRFVAAVRGSHGRHHHHLHLHR